MIVFACKVKRRTCNSLSRNTVAMSVLLSRFFMSLFAAESSSSLACSSAFTDCSSSFSDCISSFEVVSSSFVDCNSSLVDCSSSFIDLSSSCEVCISSRFARTSSRARCSSRSRSLCLVLLSKALPSLAGRFNTTGAMVSEKRIKTIPLSSFGSSSDCTFRSTKRVSESALILMFLRVIAPFFRCTV